jgi:hypothetical protein
LIVKLSSTGIHFTNLPTLSPANIYTISLLKNRNELFKEQMDKTMDGYLEGLQAKVNTLQELQSQTQEELDALLPSVLDKAFKGEIVI